MVSLLYIHANGCWYGHFAISWIDRYLEFPSFMECVFRAALISQFLHWLRRQEIANSPHVWGLCFLWRGLERLVLFTCRVFLILYLSRTDSDKLFTNYSHVKMFPYCALSFIGVKNSVSLSPFHLQLFEILSLSLSS